MSLEAGGREVSAEVTISQGSPAKFLRDLVCLCRPREWVKNSFVIAPLLFSKLITHPKSLLAGGLAFACFCLWSSALYCFNDVLDAKTDAKHPRKRNRPIPSRRVAVPTALALSGLLAVAGAGVGASLLNFPFVVVGGYYLVNGLVYCFLLKHCVIIDVISIALGFVLRIIAGCLAIGVVPTPWILVCSFSLAMLLGFGKRRLEVGALAQPTDYRPSLESYSNEKLNMLLGVCASLCLLSFILYTVAPETTQIHGTTHLVYTVPFVAYGVFRYLFKVQEGQDDGPVDVLLKDPVFAVNGILWLGTVLAILYFIK